MRHQRSHVPPAGPLALHTRDPKVPELYDTWGRAPLLVIEALMQYYLGLMFYRLLVKYLFWFLLKALLPARTLPLPLPAFCDFSVRLLP